MTKPIAIIIFSLVVTMLALCILGCGGEETSSSPAVTAAPNLGPALWDPMMSRHLPPPVVQSTPSVVPTIVPTPTPASSPVPLSTVVPTPISQSAYIPDALFLQIVEPQDGSEIEVGSGVINGKTIPGAIISVFVNDDIFIADVNDYGDFSTDVVYAFGPNMIEVLASDQKGNSIYSSFVVIGIE